ncbi:hypothetical protein KGF57_002597 [Candida theae]|uniref:Tuberous sclerosis 1 n=1 Tax=Candida theae TaxID=1198502 RepID=A0AAD5BFB8_9ASCO|nr:uncharacterized protein KGF57_002597 [Candida theae]KAI5958242.1 hypothetical protein KGF57_002597 [Candida theae]
MSGSSAALVRALEATFSEKENSRIPLDDHLSTTINEYLAKHNNLTTIKQTSNNIHEKLYRLYNGCIKPSRKLEQENTFLDVLIRLCDVFSEAEVSLWVMTYLKSAIDSAGYDSKFAAKSTKLIEKVLTNYTITECDRLNEVHERCASSLAQLLLDIYLNEDTLATKLRLDVTETTKQGQAYHERIRFIRYNCTNLLLEYGMKHTTQYCNLLNQYMQKPNYRFEVIVSLGYLINADFKNASAIVEGDLFQSLLRCLLFDLDPTLVHCALNDLLMLIPKTTAKMGKYLSDILLVYLRLTDWTFPNEAEAKDKIGFANPLHLHSGSWEVALNQYSEETAETRLNYQYLCTLIYGLYYFNFAFFLCDPKEYLSNHLSSIISFDSLEQWSLEQISETKSFKNAISITKQLLGSFLVHPKYWKKIDLQAELSSPASWISNEANPDDIAVACFSLNPNVFIGNGETADSSSLRESQVPFNGVDTISRSSSSAGPMYFQVNNPTKVHLRSRLLQQRKMSIVPTNLVIEESNHEENEDRFKFADDHDQSISDGSSMTSPSSSKQYRTEIVSHLLHDHERLFATGKHNRLYNQGNSLSRTNSLDPITTMTADETSDKSKPEMKLGRPMSSPTTNSEASNIFKDNSTTTTTTSASMGTNGDTSTLNSSGNVASHSSLNELNGNGTIIDFYQRELLLFKNELELSSYMKHLNKHHYLSVKNESLKDCELPIDSTRRDEEGKFAKVIEDVKSEWAEKQRQFDRQYDLLTTKIKELEDERDKLCAQLSELQLSAETKARECTELVQSVLPNKDYEIEQLKLKLKAMELSKHESENTISQDQAYNISLDAKEESSATQKALEDQIYNYKMEHQVLIQQIAQLEHENRVAQTRYNTMVTQYETKLEKTKLSLSDTLSSFSAPFEKRISELQAVIYKYQTLLEDRTRNSVATSSLNGAGTVPIPIVRQNSSSSSGNYSYGHEDSHGNNTVPTRPVAPIQHMFRNGSNNSSGGKTGNGITTGEGDSLPFMRGRGGLQKRTRKFM